MKLIAQLDIRFTHNSHYEDTLIYWAIRNTATQQNSPADNGPLVVDESLRSARLLEERADHKAPRAGPGLRRRERTVSGQHLERKPSGWRLALF